MKSNKASRDIAMSAARGHLRRMGFENSSMTYMSAIKALDELSRSDPDLIASKWYLSAPNSQIRQFKKDWKQWLKGKQAEFSFVAPGM